MAALSTVCEQAQKKYTRNMERSGEAQKEKNRAARIQRRQWR
jgi:hypothetical protein